MTGSLIIFDPDLFRKQFPAYANTNCFPDESLQFSWDLATNWISDEDNACYALNGASRALALNLLTAHLLYVSNQAVNGDQVAILTSASIDKVRVQVQPPPVKEGDQFGWWLNTSPYGAQLLALLNVKATGGFYVGGLPERFGFRRVGGRFG